MEIDICMPDQTKLDWAVEYMVAGLEMLLDAP